MWQRHNCCITLSAKLAPLVTLTNDFISLLLTVIRSWSYEPATWTILERSLLLVILSVYLTADSFLKQRISNDWNLFLKILVQIHDLHAYRIIEMTRALLSLSFDLGAMILFFQLLFSFDKSAITLAVLFSISGFKFWSLMMEPRYCLLLIWYLKLLILRKIYPFCLSSF